MENPVYLRIKEQLAATRTVYPQCRFLYLLGRRDDGSIFFYVDSEPSSSKECSLPGQSYEEVSDGCRRVFATHAGEVVGPYTDRWSTWVSGFVPVLTSPKPRPGTATPMEAQQLVGKAVGFDREKGREQLGRLRVCESSRQSHRTENHLCRADRRCGYLRRSLQGNGFACCRAGHGYRRRQLESHAGSRCISACVAHAGIDGNFFVGLVAFGQA